MSLETASYIGQLNPAWPDGDADDVSQGDDQLRLIKTVLQTQFNNLGNAAVTATAAQLNTAAISAGQYTSGTSTTSLTVALGAQNFTTQAGLGFAVGMRLRLVHRTNLANTMEGPCTAYDKVTGAGSITADAISGGGTYADWSVFVVLDVIVPEEKQRTITGNDTMLPADRQKVLHYTGAADSTLALSTAASVGNGNFCTLRNASNTNWTIDPAGAELICGLAAIVIKPGFTARLKCDGVGFDLQWTKIRQHFGPYLVTASDTWTVPPDIYVIRPYVVGAGSAATTTDAGAGGGMAYGDIAVTPGQVVTRSISAGVAKITIGGVDMLTGNPASGLVAGTASKHASVTNGGAFSGGAGGGATGGASSGSPLGTGVAASGSATGGAGWGGAGSSFGGGGTGGAASAGAPGAAISVQNTSAEPLLALLNGSTGGRGAGGLSGAPGQMGGIGGGSGATATGTLPPLAPGFGGGGGANNGSAPRTGGAGGYGGGGGRGDTAGGAGGAAAILFLVGVPQ